ncbi:MAG: RNA-directed DNA polymerase [Candidatus Anammoximicrobium sp.]|nr:RNA-directed DNA polymerase [Candidatus Anammoximicrobium sp.]
MKSVGGLFEIITNAANLESAMHRAAQGKRHRKSVQRFLADGPAELEQLHADLIDGTYRPLPYRQFSVRDPKPRLISCADFRDRVVHHAICGQLAPVIERRLIDDTYACRCGKGSHRAVLRAQAFCRRYRYCLKTDIRRYYDSVDHATLEDLLGRLLRESALRQLLSTIIRHPLPGQMPGRGLPIGNLTSQWFGNLYLDETDHWIKETRGAPGYVRYMDDLVVWSDSKAWLWALADDLEEHVGATRSLQLKAERTLVAPCSVGVPFLGYRIFPGLIRHQGQRARRRRRLFRQREEAYLRGELTAQELTACARSMDGSRQFLRAGEPLRSEIEL